jgi:hypothetical protein
MTEYMTYPKEDDSRSGCKVGWLIYKDRELAEVAAKAAKHNSILDAQRGYDFGYQCPGSISKLNDGRFEVCIP